MTAMRALLVRLLPLLFLLTPAISRAAESEALRQFVEELSVAAGVHFAIANFADIESLYADNRNHFFWFEDGPLATMRDDLIGEIHASADHGFNPLRYHFDALIDQTLPDEIREVLYTDALLSQIRHRSNGVLSGQEKEWFVEKPAVDALGMLRSLVEEGDNVGDMLRQLWPSHAEYWALLAKRAEFAAQKDVQTEKIPAGPLLRKGDTGSRVYQLQTRLLGPGDHAGVFDQQLSDTVKDLQRSAALEADGIVGEATLGILNANRFSWIDRIDANLERWRWLPHEEQSTHIRVNIASFRLRAIESGGEEYDMDVIVGRPFRQTPIFTESMKYLVFFPYWNVPTSIAIKDKLPLLRKDAEPLALLGYEAQLSGSDEFVPVNTIDWKQIKAGGFLLRQRPGEKNALGRVKFMLPNVHNIYLHDTPDRALFNSIERIFSSGCIRVSDPEGLAEWVLRQDKNPQMASTRQLFQSGLTTTVYLKKPIPVLLVYFTAFIDDGRVVFRRDVYERDQRIVDELRSDGRSL